MTQTRFFLRLGRAEAGAIADRLEAAFEAAPIALVEVDEAAGIHEVSIYFDDAAGPDRAADVAAVLADRPDLTVEREAVPDIDWMAAVLAGLAPVRAGRFLVHGAHDRRQVRPNDRAIEIEAGEAFGTGHHETTAGCLEAIGRIARRRRPAETLDLGTGSAVLAIAVARLCRTRVLATDIDPVAIRVARRNARANGVGGLVRTLVAPGLHANLIRRRAPFDLIAANILAEPLRRLAPGLARCLAPGGDLVLSGILARQRRAVRAAYRAQGLVIVETLRRGDWVTLHLSRPHGPVSAARGR